MRNFREVEKTNGKFETGLFRLLKIYLSEFDGHYSIIDRGNGLFLELAAVTSVQKKDEFKERLKELRIFKFEIPNEKKPNQIRIVSFNFFAIKCFQILFFPFGKPKKMDDRIWALLPDEVRFNWNNFSEQLCADIIAYLSCNLAMNYQNLVKAKLGELGNSNNKLLKDQLLAPMIKMLRFKDKDLIKENLMANSAGASPLVRPVSCSNTGSNELLPIKVFLPNSNEEQLLTEVLKKRTLEKSIDLSSLQMAKPSQFQKGGNDNDESQFRLRDLSQNPQRSASIPVDTHHKNDRIRSSPHAIQRFDDSDEETASSTSPASIDEHDWPNNSDLDEIQDNTHSPYTGGSLNLTVGSSISAEQTAKEPDFDPYAHIKDNEGFPCFEEHEAQLKWQEDPRESPNDIKKDNMLTSVALPQEQNNEADKTNLITLFKDKHKKCLDQDKRKRCCLFYRPQTKTKRINTLEGFVAHAQKENNRSRRVMLDLGWLLKNGDINMDNTELPQEIRSMYRPK